MLIEDNCTDVYVITQVLKELGLDQYLQVVSDGAAALRLWDSIQEDPQKPAPRLVLLDLNLPKASGIDVLRCIRNGRRCASVPVVVVTSSGSPEDIAAAGELNASAYFQKPADLSEYMALGEIVSAILPLT